MKTHWVLCMKLRRDEKLHVMEASESIMFYESSEKAKKLKKALEDLKRSTEFERKR